MKNIYTIFAILIAPFKISSQISERGLGQGPFSGNLAYNNQCTFSFNTFVGYSPATNVLNSDNVYATVSHCANCDLNTTCLIVSGFGFNIPVTGSVTGIALEIEKKRSTGGSGNVVDNGVQLMKVFLEVGQNKADITTDWPAIDTYVMYGGVRDLWGTTWTPAEVNAPDFAVAIASISYATVTTITSIDHVRMTVYYSTSTGITETATSDGNISVSPNPVQSGNKIQFSNIKKMDAIKMFDVSGKEVFKGNSETNEMRLPNLNSGLYFYQIKNEGNLTTGKLIVK